MAGRYPIEPDDITIVELEPRVCEDCGDNIATHVVMVDLRSIGMNVGIGNFCQACATENVERMKSGIFDL
jgi:ribosomal protein L37AE/L43A